MVSVNSNKIREYLKSGRRERLRHDHLAALAAFEAAAAIDAGNSVVEIERARTLRVLDRLDEANVLLDGLLDAEPGHVGALIERGQIRRRQGNHEGAASAFKAAAKADPQNRNIQVELARDLRAIDRLDEANAVITNILGHDANHIGALIERGHICRRRSDHAGALAAFTAAATADPQNRNIQVELARDLRAIDRLDEANAVITNILGLDASHIGALIERGHICRRRSDHAGALAAFTAVATADPQNRNIQVELARDLRALDRLDEAGAVLNNVLDAEPGKVAALIERGLVLRRRQDYAGAATAFTAAVAAEPLNRNIQVELARDLRAVGRLDDADLVLDNVLAAEPTKVGALIERGLVLRRRQDYAGAATAFKAAVAAEPLNQNIQVELARDLRAVGRLDDADLVLDNVLAAEPTKVGALIERGHICRQRGDHMAALTKFEAAAAIDTRNSGLQLEIVTTLRALGRLRGAEMILRELIDADPNNLLAIVRLGHLLMDTNRLEEADGLLNRALRTYPNDHRLFVALGHLARRRGDRAKALQFFRSATEADPANLDLKLDYAAELRDQGSV